MTSGTHPSTRRATVSLKRSARLTAIVLLASTQASFAGFIGPNPGSVAGITYNVDTVAAGGGAAPAYGVLNDLENISKLPGAGAYGDISSGLNVLVNNYGGGLAAPVAPLGTFFAFQAAVGGVNGSTFGDTIGGDAKLSANTTGAGSGAGVFWTNPTFLADTGVDGKASVALARGHATFTDPTGDVGKVPGLSLAISGTLGAPGAFAAASVAGTFTIRNAANMIVGGPFMAWVAVVSDGLGPKSDFITSSPLTGGGTFLSNSSGLSTSSFYAFGSLLLPAVTIPMGGSIELDGTLSFVTDPDATLQIDVLPPSLPLPDLMMGAFAVPEPASIVMMGLGTLATLVCCRRRRRAPTARPDQV